MANTEGVNIVISGDNSQAVKAIEDLIKAIDGVKDSKVKITADASQAIGEAGKVASTVESINDAHVNITADSSQAVDESGKASSAMENIADAHSEITADSSQAVDEANKLADAEEALNDAHVEITADSSQAVGEADKAANALENINDAHTEITADASQAVDVAKKVQKFISEINGKKITFTVNPLFKDSLGRWHDIHGRFVQMGQKAGEAFSSEFSSASVQGVEKTLGSMLALDVGGKLANGFGTVLTTIASVLQRVAGAVSSVMKSALAIGGGFESVMTSVRVISGATENELDALTKKAREMGATLPITAKDAATAIQLLAQRGTQAKDILATVSEVANLTISQGVDMASSAEILGSTMTNFGIAVNDASKITAIFNNACNQSALSMSKLIEAMKYVGPAAGAVDMQLTEAVAAMEAIANAGLTGEMTGTGLAMVLSKLAAKSQIAGVQTKELDGSLRPLKDIFIELKAKGFSLVDAIEAFGQRGSKAALALAKNSDKLAENEERLKNWGSTQAAVDAKAKTFTNTMAALRSAIEEFHIEIFEQIKDQSKEAVGGLAELTRAFSKWVDETQIAGKSLNAFLQGLGFNIPSGADFERLLKQFDVQAFVDRIKEFGSTLKGIGESIAGMFDKIKAPLSWLIEHLDTFAQISFWGWILGKGLQIPAAILGIASSFTMLASSLKGLLGLKLAGLAGLIATPVGLAVSTVAVGLGAGAYAASKHNAEREELSKALDEEKRYLQEQAKADFSLPVDIQFDFKTGFEKLPESWTKASDKVREEANATVKELQDKFRVKASEAVLAVMAKFPELADKFQDSAGNIGEISNSVLRQISNALNGDEKAFAGLSEPMRKVTEEINRMNMAVGKGNIQLLDMFSKFQQEAKSPMKFDFETGFEKLPEDWTNASTKLRAEIDITVKELQKNFRHEVSEAILAVMAHFPEMADKFKDSTGNIVQISNSALQQISSAFHGDEKAFKALPEHLQKVTEQLNAMRMAASEWQIQSRKLVSETLLSRIESAVKKDESVAFLEQFNASVKNITESLSGEIDRANKFLGGANGQLVVQLSLSQAQKKLDKFVKSAKKEYSIGEDIIQARVYTELEKLAKAGNTAAQSLINSWKGTGNSLDEFLNNAQEAIKYLEASPDKFMPALNKLMAGIQKIDPLTGKVTEQFKKAHDALKQWRNVTFGQLENRLQRLRKAYEGGFISEKALKAEFKRAIPQIRLQVVKDLEPQRGQYRNERDYQAVVASEFMSRINDMLGDLGMDMMRNMFKGSTGEGIGRSILYQVERDIAKSTGSMSKSTGDLLSSPSATVKINGLDMFTHGLESISTLPKNISEAVNPYVMKLEQLNSTQSKIFSHVKDYSAEIANIIREIQALGGNIEALRKSTVDNTSAMTQLQGSFASVNSSADTQSASNDFKALTVAV